MAFIDCKRLLMVSFSLSYRYGSFGRSLICCCFICGLSVPLRRYTPGWSAVKILSFGVDVLERRKDFAAAVDLLSALLAQRVFCIGSRGRW